MTARIAALALALSLTGCSLSLPLAAPPTKVSYYVLAGPTPPARKLASPRIGVMPVSLPGYLARPQLVLRSGDGVNIIVHDFHRWGEELSRGIARVICDSLATEGRYAVPLRTGTRVDIRLMLDIRRLDGPLGGDVVLDAVWALQKDKEVLSSGHVVQSREAGDSLETMVEAQSALIRGLAQEIAGRI